MRRLPPLLLVSLLSLSAGCVGGAGGEAVVELGGGEWRFEELAPEQEVELIAGIQGGFHVWVSARAEGLDPERVRMLLLTQPADGSREPERSEVRIDMAWDEEAQEHRLVGWPAVLAEPGCVVDRPLLIELTLTDQQGLRGSDQRVVIPRAGPVAEELLPACP